MSKYKCNKDFYYHDTLIAAKGDVVEIVGTSLINLPRNTRCENRSELWKHLKDSTFTKVEEENDMVNHPSHYTSHPSGIECIEITRYYCFAIGNAIKYLWRAGLKKDASLKDKQKEIEDLQKAVWYINDRIKQLKDGN